MHTKRFQSRVASWRYTLLAALCIAIACRGVALLVLPAPPVAGGGGTLWAQYAGWLSGLPAYWLGFLWQLLVGWLLIMLNNTFALIRVRASFQSAVFLVLTAVVGPAFYPFQAGDAASASVVASLFFLFRSYRDPSAAVDHFLAASCLGLGSLAVPQLLFFLPVYWVGGYWFQSLSVKSFCASLLGAMLPYWFLFGHACWHGEPALFVAPFLDMAAFAPLFQGMDAGRAVLLACLFVLFAVSAGHFLSWGYEDKIRTRCHLRFFVLLAFCLFLYAFLQPQSGLCLVPVLSACVSVLAGHLFVLAHGRLSNGFFIGTLTVAAVLYVFELWMQLG